MADIGPEDALPEFVDGLYQAADDSPRPPERSRLKTAAEALANAPEKPAADALQTVVKKVANGQTACLGDDPSDSLRSEQRPGDDGQIEQVSSEVGAAVLGRQQACGVIDDEQHPMC